MLFITKVCDECGLWSFTGGGGGRKEEYAGRIVRTGEKANITLKIFYHDISLGREKPILEMETRLDDLLEKQQMGVQLLDLEYVSLNVARILQLLNKTFLKR